VLSVSVGEIQFSLPLNLAALNCSNEVDANLRNGGESRARRY
jgi:hypothetical protein